MPLQHKTTALISTKHKANDQGKLHATKKIKLTSFNNLSNDTMKQKNENESDRPKKNQD